MASVSLRPHFCEQNNLQRPDGSASYCQGETVVQAAVYGPAEVRIQKELITKALIEVVYKPKVGLPGCQDKLRERIIRNTCDTVLLSLLHPRTSVTIVLQEVHNAGSLLACCINAACLALMDSGMEMKCLVAAVSCAIDKDGMIIVDPTLLQEKESVALLTFAFDSHKRNVIASTTRGLFSDVEYHSCLMACSKASSDILKFYRQSVNKKFLKDSGNES